MRMIGVFFFSPKIVDVSEKRGFFRGHHQKNNNKFSLGFSINYKPSILWYCTYFWISTHMMLYQLESRSKKATFWEWLASHLLSPRCSWKMPTIFFREIPQTHLMTPVKSVKNTGKEWVQKNISTDSLIVRSMKAHTHTHIKLNSNN